MQIVDCKCQDCGHKVLDVYADSIPKVCPWCGTEGKMKRCLATGNYATTEVDGVPLNLGDGNVLRGKGEREAYAKSLNKLHGTSGLTLEPRDGYKDKVRAAEAAHVADGLLRRNGNEDKRRSLNNRRWRSM